MKSHTAEVVIAAGGLGTRVAGWARMLPKEFRPVGGQPGLCHILEEAAASGAQRAVVVHHPYYAPFYDWNRHVTSPGSHDRYRQAAGQPTGPRPAVEELAVDFIPQRGRYADITSALNGSAHLRTGTVSLLFADNVDPSHTALARLLDATDPDHPAFLAAPFSISGAQSHGVVICSGSGTVRTMAGLVEKPGAQQAARLADEHGADNLRLLQGRGRITPDLLHHLAATSRHASTHIEPKLALALAAYARRRPVQIVTSSAAMVDLGAPEPDAAAA
ncbi:NTP transferase domain-containing protein [Kitasatospora aburaviensis]|uniref:NTP transferase domain-containing protein n=1 Tax=Kitasatospora aburaviensis TaxID=67265 RepID=A0ABW1EXC0_9ACTN